MTLPQAKTFMRKAANRELWFMEATGSSDHPLQTAYQEPYLYVQEEYHEGHYNDVDVYDVQNICGESEYDVSLDFAIRKFPRLNWCKKGGK